MIATIVIIMKTKWKLIGERTIQQFGNSEGVPIPSDVQDFLGVKLGGKVILVLDREEKELRVIPSKDVYGMKEGSDRKMGFELSIPKELLKKLEKK